MNDPNEYMKGYEPEGWSDSSSRAPVGPLEETAELDDAGRIAEDIACRACGYNLRGVDPESICPECGTAIGWSLVGDRLKFADPTWVRRLNTGSMWLIGAVIFHLTLGCVARGAGQGVAGEEMPLLVELLKMVPNVIVAVGCWMVTAPEPVEKFSGPIRLREVARWCCVVPVVIDLVVTPIRVQGDPLTTGTVLEILDLFSGLTGLVGLFSILSYARRLALRVPDESLAAQTRVVMWGLGCSMGALLLLTIVALAVQPAKAGAGLASVVVLACGGTGALMVFAIWVVVLLFFFRNRLGEAAYEAEQSWARNTTPY